MNIISIVLYQSEIVVSSLFRCLIFREKTELNADSVFLNADRTFDLSDVNWFPICRAQSNTDNKQPTVLEKLHFLTVSSLKTFYNCQQCLFFDYEITDTTILPSFVIETKQARHYDSTNRQGPFPLMQKATMTTLSIDYRPLQILTHF